MTNNAKPTGFETDIDKAANAFEAMLTPQEEVEETEVEEQEAELAQEELEEEEVLEEEEEEALEASEDFEDETEQSEESQVETEETEQPLSFTVKVDGEELEVSQDELIRGYSRQKDYTRKTQEIAEVRKQIEAESSQVEEERQIYKELLPKLKTIYENGMEAEPDWEALEKADPTTYLIEKNKWNERKQQLRAFEEEQARLQEEEALKNRELMTKQIQEGQEQLLTLIPEWTDAEKAASEKAAIVQNTIKNYGFSQEEINTVYDARLIPLMRDAWKFKKATEAAKKKPTQKAKSRVARAGTSNTVKTTSPLKKAKTRLAKSGKVSDAAKLFEHLI
tara:strand:+ start:1469 stop:2476 length:1008 start_codon:yes stop_codon:yes gene_type:complete